jgi:hypothetical protein
MKLAVIRYLKRTPHRGEWSIESRRLIPSLLATTPTQAIVTRHLHTFPRKRPGHLRALHQHHHGLAVVHRLAAPAGRGGRRINPNLLLTLLALAMLSFRESR